VSPDYTRLQIRSDDSFGFLFEFTNALALLGVNIERAEIRTVGNEAHDTFWVTDAQRHKIDDEARLRDLRVAAALIKHFTHLLPASPNPAQALRQFSALTAQMLSRPDWTAELRDLESGAVLATLAELMGVSRFLWDDFLRMQHGNLFPVIVDTPALDVAPTKAELDEQLSARLAGFTDHAERVRALNEFKDREMFRVDLRHITRRVDFVGFSRELSEVAEAIVSATATLAHESLRERTEGTDGSRTPWCICALGKFGGQEMGFASDVELIFVYGGEGRAAAPERSQYFERFVRAFLSTLRVHRQGVFEVDLRLRPYGDAGALATSVDGFVDYLARPGGARQFERMALVKLRHVAGDLALAGRVLDARDAFVYSGDPLDAGDILHLRRRQSAELVTPGTVNAKYSQGGLVDIEYFVQARQIEAGRDDPQVRVTGTLDGIERLEQGGHLGGSDAAKLRAAYAFLRRLIDALRVVRGNARDLTIPPPQSREFAYLARRLESSTAAGLRSEIEAQMGVARALWPAESAEER
jgi:glutamate-ammonia-ligase adenylyltransferase